MLRTISGLALSIGLVAASFGSAIAQQYGYAPNGSYQQSCSNVQMRGSTLYASCMTNNGQHNNSSLNVSGCRGDIANNNGNLQCNGYNGGYNNGGYNNGGYNNGGYNNGGYNNGGDNNGNDNDRDDHHHHRWHQNRNGNYNNGNGNGNGSYGYGYNGYGLPGGSYQQSCTNERMNGSSLFATCTSGSGSQVNSSIDVNVCRQRGTDIANVNGRLRC